MAEGEECAHSFDLFQHDVLQRVHLVLVQSGVQVGLQPCEPASQVREVCLDFTDHTYQMHGGDPSPERENNGITRHSREVVEVGSVLEVLDIQINLQQSASVLSAAKGCDVRVCTQSTCSRHSVVWRTEAAIQSICIVYPVRRRTVVGSNRQ